MVRKQYVKKDDIKIILANDMNECKFFGLISKIQDRLHQGIETKEFIKEQYNNKKSFLKEPGKIGGKTGLNNIYNKIVREIFNKDEKFILNDYMNRYKFIDTAKLIRDLGDKRIQIIGARTSEDLCYRNYIGIGYRMKGINDPQVTHINNKMRVIDNTDEIDLIYTCSENTVIGYYNSIFQRIKQKENLLEDKVSKVNTLINDLTFNKDEKIILIKNLINHLPTPEDI